MRMEKSSKPKLWMSPLQMMSRFYKDYNYSSQKQKQKQSEPPICKYHKPKTSSTDKITAFLNNHNNHLYVTTPQNPYRTPSHTAHMPMGQTNMRGHTSNTPLRNRLPSVDRDPDPKRSYFKNVFSDSHPMLVSDHKIGPKHIPRKMSTEPAVQADNRAIA